MRIKKKPPPRPGEEPVKFTTFGGVFTPSVLTILGVIMFLRFPTVIGYGGIKVALLVLLAAKAITLITGLSISSIATNMHVKGGGAYYLISRSLGIEFGGMIALFFYGAQAVAVSIYVFGFSETLFNAFPGLDMPFLMVATLTNIAVFICVYIGAKWTIRVQYGVLTILMLSLVSFFIGALLRFSPDALNSNLMPVLSREGQNFFTLFALFFPAVTGIMAGVNMSGDLKDPNRSLPRGTLTAIAFTAIIYLLMAFLLAGSNTREALLGEGFVIKNTALWGSLIYAGVVCATLSSALGSMMGAPRIIQAFARDNIFTRIKWLGKGSGISNEPRAAIILTFLVAQAGIMTGGLDNVAPIITMFFLITYGTINLACFYESITRNPSFRPTFKFNHWSIALLGTLGCLAVMFMINPLWAALALLLVGALYFLIARAEIMVQWGDLKSGLAFQRARKSLLRIEREMYHPKNWRPSILTLSGGAWNRLNLVKYASLFSADTGIVSLAQIITGDLDDRFAHQIEAEKMMRNFIREKDLEAFPVVIVDENFQDALKALIQCHGIGGLRPNTLLLGWSNDAGKTGTFSSILTLAKKMRRSLLVVKCTREGEEDWVHPRGAINLWWNHPSSAPLMLMMAFLLHENTRWRTCPIRILYTPKPKADKDNILEEMATVLKEARIDAEVLVLPSTDPLDAVRRAMAPSAVLFAGFDPANDDQNGKIPSHMKDIVDLPGDVILVYNAGDVALGA